MCEATLSLAVWTFCYYVKNYIILCSLHPVPTFLPVPSNFKFHFWVFWVSEKGLLCARDSSEAVL